MQWIVVVGFLEGVLDSEANTILKTLKKTGYENVKKAKTAVKYIINANITEKEKIEDIAKKIIINPLINSFVIQRADEREKEKKFNYNIIEIKQKKGDPLGNSTKNNFLNLGCAVEEINTSKLYLLKGNLTKSTLEKIAKEFFCNPISEEYKIFIHEQQL